MYFVEAGRIRISVGVTGIDVAYFPGILYANYHLTKKKSLKDIFSDFLSHGMGYLSENSRC